MATQGTQKTETPTKQTAPSAAANDSASKTSAETQNSAPQTKTQSKASTPTKAKSATKSTKKSSGAKKSRSTQTKPKAAKKTSTAEKTARKTARKTNAKRQSAKTKTQTKSTPSSTQRKEPTMPKTMDAANFEQFSKQFFDGFEQMAGMNKEIFDAVLQSTNIAAKGYQDMLKDSMGYSQETAEQLMASVKELMTSRSLNEFTEKQNQFAQTTLNKTMSGATQFTEKYIRVCTEAAEPLNTQIGKAMEKAAKETKKAA